MIKGTMLVFQALIGTAKTSAIGEFDLHVYLFQALIGTAKTW